MSELMAEIQNEAKQFLDSELTYVQRDLSRKAIVYAGNSEISITQTKFVTATSAEDLKAETLQPLATPEWFSDVDFMKHPSNKQLTWDNQLNLSAEYPLGYFDKRPTNGTFHGDAWLDQYGSISGFGPSNGKINTWDLSHASLDEPKITQLWYPEEPDAIEQYNEHYRRYLELLNKQENPTVHYYQGWERQFSQYAKMDQLVYGKMSLGGIGVRETLRHSATETPSKATITRLRFQYDPKKHGQVGRILRISGDSEATTETYWKEKGEKQASQRLLRTALELLQDARQTQANQH